SLQLWSTLAPALHLPKYADATALGANGVLGDCVMSTVFSKLAVAAAFVAIASAAQAAPIATTIEAIGSVGFGAKAGSTVIDFNSGLPSDPNFSATGTSFGLHTGSAAGVAATPFGDVTQYYSTGLGTTTITFNDEKTYLGFLWGSIDSYNRIAFYDGDTLIG